MAQYSSKHQVVKYLDEITKQFDNKKFGYFHYKVYKSDITSV